MFCSQCGTKNDDSAKFCSSCGTAVSAAVASPHRNQATESIESQSTDKRQVDMLPAKCPSCSYSIWLNSSQCPKCKADFCIAKSWKPIPMSQAEAIANPPKIDGGEIDAIAPFTKDVNTILDTSKKAQIMKCPFCAEEISREAIKCKHCGSTIDQAKLAETLHARTGTADSSQNLSDLSPYYRKAFAEIDKSNGNFTVVFNVAAFFFGAIWYLYKGMWAKGLLMIAIGILLAGVPFFFFIIYCSIAGTYDYYLLTVKKKQLW